jgi:hypothetical protein
VEHKLRVLVSLDMDCASAVIKIAGCLTDDSCKALVPLIRRLHGLSPGIAVTVGLTDARHIESRGLQTLHLFSSGEPADGELAETAMPYVPFTRALNITVPKDLPQCPALIVRQRFGEVAA